MRSDRWFAWIYHRLLSNVGVSRYGDSPASDVRGPLLAQARGAVLEIGAGDGANLGWYPPGVRVTLLDPNMYMLRYVPPTLPTASKITWATVCAPGERLPFAPRSFDTVVTTHVLCSVSDLPQVLQEIRRVLRPGGLFLFLEHVAAPSASLTFRVQRLLNPLWSAVGGGCQLNRDTAAAIEAAGFEHVALQTFRARYHAFVSPHVSGQARA